MVLYPTHRRYGRFPLEWARALRSMVRMYGTTRAGMKKDRSMMMTIISWKGMDCRKTGFRNR